MWVEGLLWDRVDVSDIRRLVIRAAAADGDEADRLAAFGELVGRFQDMAYGYAYSVLSDFHSAEDATQDAFVTAFERLDTLRDPAAFAGWLRRIVRTACSRLVRRKDFHFLPLAATASAPIASHDPARAAEKSELRDAVMKAIQDLAEPQREVTTLFYINGYSHKDIADFLEVPVGTVKTRLHASRKRLRKRMLVMVEDTLKSNRPGPQERQAVIDELMSRKAEFDAGPWHTSQKWADRWNRGRIQDVRANAAQYGIDPDESLPRMLPEYQLSETFRDDFKDIPQRWGIPEGTRLVLMRELCRDVGATPAALLRWAADGLPVLRYRPWTAYDWDRAKEWITGHGIRPGEKMNPSEAREPLLLTLRFLAEGKVTVDEAAAVLSGMMASTVMAAKSLRDAERPDADVPDPLWSPQWCSQQAEDRRQNARQYGLAEPTGNWFGIPAEVHESRVFEIRDLCRRLGLSPFDIVRWTGRGMPCLKRSPWVRWDLQRVVEWIAQAACMPSQKHSPRELDDLPAFILPAVAAGNQPPEDAREIFTGWLGLM